MILALGNLGCGTGRYHSITARRSGSLGVNILRIVYYEIGSGYIHALALGAMSLQDVGDIYASIPIITNETFQFPVQAALYTCRILYRRCTSLCHSYITGTFARTCDKSFLNFKGPMVSPPQAVP